MAHAEGGDEQRITQPEKSFWFKPHTQIFLRTEKHTTKGESRSCQCVGLGDTSLSGCTEFDP